MAKKLLTWKTDYIIALCSSASHFERLKMNLFLATQYVGWSIYIHNEDWVLPLHLSTMTQLQKKENNNFYTSNIKYLRWIYCCIVTKITEYHRCFFLKPLVKLCLLIKQDIVNIPWKQSHTMFVWNRTKVSIPCSILHNDCFFPSILERMQDENNDHTWWWALGFHNHNLEISYTMETDILECFRIQIRSIKLEYIHNCHVLNIPTKATTMSSRLWNEGCFQALYSITSPSSLQLVVHSHNS